MLKSWITFVKEHTVCTRSLNNAVYGTKHKGPGHMKSFAEDPAVLETFKEVALERSCYPGIIIILWCMDTLVHLQSDKYYGHSAAVEHSTVSNTNLFMKKPIVLHSQHSKDYRSDQLYKLIPSIVNPAGVLYL